MNAPSDLEVFLRDLLDTNHIQFVDQNEVPIVGAQVDIYQAAYCPGIYGRSYDNVPNISFLTDEDGMRIWVDGTSVLDKWFSQPETTYTFDRVLDGGMHRTHVEYFEEGGNATAKLVWCARRLLRHHAWRSELESERRFGRR